MLENVGPRDRKQKSGNQVFDFSFGELLFNTTFDYHNIDLHFSPYNNSGTNQFLEDMSRGSISQHTDNDPYLAIIVQMSHNGNDHGSRIRRYINRTKTYISL